MKEYFLKTARLGFSIWEEEDYKEALELWGNPKVTRYIVAGGTMSPELVKQRLIKEIKTYDSEKFQYFPIYLLESDYNAGCCGVRPYDKQKDILEFGIHLKESCWGKGLAQEAGSAVIEYAFRVLGVKAIFAGHNPINLASSKLLKKLGFTYIGEEFYEPTGLMHPSYLLKREDYERALNN